MRQLPIPDSLASERLLLQRLRYEDAEEMFYAYASKDEATKFVTWRTHRSVDDTRAFLRYAVPAWEHGTDYAYSIRLANRVLAGSIGVVHDEGKLQLGYILSPLHWGRGYATEACLMLLSAVRDISGIYRIGTFVDAENTASIRVLARAGMKEEAVLPRWCRFVNQGNAPKDCILYRLKP